MNMKIMRYFLWVLVIVAVLAVGMQYLIPKNLPTDSAHGEALIGGDFSLVDQHGNAFTQDNLQGKHSLIFFGFTHCPDVCPTSLLIITQAIAAMEDSSSVQPIFITVDPWRDTSERIKQYISSFSEDIVGLTGPEEALQQVQKAYKVYARKVDMPHMGDDAYMMDHSGFIFLMGPDGKYREHFPYNTPAEKITQTLIKHIYNEQ